MNRNPNPEIEELVPRSRAAAEFHVVPRTIARWENLKLPGFDDPVEINRRIYHRRSGIERAKSGRKSVEAV